MQFRGSYDILRQLRGGRSPLVRYWCIFYGPWKGFVMVICEGLGMGICIEGIVASCQKWEDRKTYHSYTFSLWLTSTWLSLCHSWFPAVAKPAHLAWTSPADAQLFRGVLVRPGCRPRTQPWTFLNLSVWNAGWISLPDSCRFRPLFGPAAAAFGLTWWRFLLHMPFPYSCRLVEILWSVCPAPTFISPNEQT